VIVVDDSGSFIPPYQDLAMLHGRYTYIIRSGQPGPAPSRNMALDLVRTPYVMFLDDDDTIAPDHLQTLATHITERTDAQRPPILFCDFTVQNEDRTTTPPTLISAQAISLTHINRDSVYVLNRIPNSCVLYRYDVVANLRHDTAMEIYEDWDFLLACLHSHDLLHVPSASVNIHKTPADAPENMRRGNSRNDLTAEVTLQLYKKHPARNVETRLARQQLLANAGVTVPLDDC
jgi:glycosyltransferase involved in cell wall biosynthesis